MRNRGKMQTAALVLAGAVAVGQTGSYTAAAEPKEEIAEAADVIAADVYEDWADYVDAAAQLLSEYPCDYKSTLDINVESGVVLDQDGEAVEIVDEVVKDAVRQDNVDAAAVLLRENGYMVLAADEVTVSVEDPWQTMRLMVEADDGLPSSFGAEAVISYGSEYILQFSTEEETIEAYTELSEDPAVREVREDTLVHLMDNECDETTVIVESLTSMNSGAHFSWGVATMGMGVMQDTLAASDEEPEEVVVAVVDTGVYDTNLYLEGRVLEGYDYVNDDDDAMDDNGHGTHVAGIVVDSTSDNVMILPVKVIGSDGIGSVLAVVSGIKYAVDAGADVINLSLGLEDYEQAETCFDEILDYAEDQGCVVVCAAGNSAINTNFAYPARSEQVIAVSAITSSLSLASYSNYGSAIDFCAPGSSVISTYKNGLAMKSGTSMAAPHISAAIALLKTWDSTLTKSQIVSLLEMYSTDLGEEGWDTSYGYGYVNFGEFDYELVIEDYIDEVDTGIEGSGNDSGNTESGNESGDSETVPEPVDLSGASVSFLTANYTYDGKEKCPGVTVICDGTVLTQGTDYLVSYSNNVNAGTASVTVTGINDYTGTASAEFTIAKAEQTLSVSAANASLTVGNTTTITASASGGGALSYASGNTSVATVSGTTVTAKAAGTAVITVKAAETVNYKAVSKSVTITVGLSKTAISSISNTTDGVKLTWNKVTGASGYYIYRSSSSSGTYTKIATVSGGSSTAYTNGTSGTYKVAGGSTYYYKVAAYAGSTSSAYSSAKGIRCLTAGKISSLTNTSAGITIKWSKVSGASGYYIYRGSTKIKTITSASTVSYQDTAVKNKNGTAYSYYVRPYYKNSAGAVTWGSYRTAKTVRLVATGLSGVKNSSSKKMTVKWSKKSSVTGYQIQYSTSSSFSSGNKTVTVSGASSTSKTISGLTKNKKYYVRIRTYRTVSGTTYYSAWSSKKSVKISK